MKFYLKKQSIKLFTLLLIIVSVFAQFAPVQALESSMISYQGRLTDSSGNLLGGSNGITYFFKFSFWTTSDTQTGSRVWPSSAPNSISLVVRQGVFNVNIGDTDEGYPDVLDYNFNSNQDVYLQVEVSSNNSVFETLGPRQKIIPSSYAQSAGSAGYVRGVEQSSFGTTTPLDNSIVTIQSTSSASTALSLIASNGQTANMFTILDSDSNSLFSINNEGDVSMSDFIANVATTTSLFSTFLNATDFLADNATTTNMFATNLFADTFSLGAVNGLLLGINGEVSAISTSTLFANYYTKSESDLTYDVLGTATSLIGTHESTYDHSLIATALQSESDPVYGAWDKSSGIVITESQISDLQSYLTSFTETDPIFTVHDAFDITATDITNLSNLSGTNTGDQDLSGLVPYTGATGDVNLGINDLFVGGNVGIRTNTPLFPLTVVQTGITPEASALPFSTSQNDSIIAIQGAGQAYVMTRDVTNNIEGMLGVSSAGVTFFGSMTDHALSLRAGNNAGLGNVEYMRIASGGNVGIGTTSPANKLSVSSALSNSSQVSTQVIDSSTGQSAYLGVRKYGSGASYGGIWFGTSPNDGNYTLLGNSANTFFNTPSGGAMYFRNNNTDKMIITSDGNVGIGTTAPAAALTIKRSGTDLPGLRLEDGDITTSFTGVGFNPNVNTNTIGMWSAAASASGGIAFNGLTSNTPSAYPIAFSGYHGSTAPTNAAISFSARKSNGTTGATGLAATEKAFSFFNDTIVGTELLTILGGGNVGIGTTTPSTRLHIVQPSQVSTREGFLKFNVSDAGNDTFQIANGTAIDGRFIPVFSGYIDSTNSRESTGLLGLVSAANDASNSSPAGIINILAARTNSTSDPINGTFTSIVNRNLFSIAHNAIYTTESDFAMIVKPNGTVVFPSGGNIGIGTTTPTELLSVAGNAQFTGVTSGAYAFDLNLTSDGTLTTASSDERLKKNIVTLNSADILDKMMQLRPSQFDWKSNSAHDIGLIAQEVETVFPELVFTNPTDGYKGINYSRISIMLISAVQELHTKIVGLFDGTGQARVRELCIEDVCISKTELLELLGEDAGGNSQTEDTGGTPGDTNTSDGGTSEGNNETSTSTPTTETGTDSDGETQETESNPIDQGGDTGGSETEVPPTEPEDTPPSEEPAPEEEVPAPQEDQSQSEQSSPETSNEAPAV